MVVVSDTDGPSDTVTSGDDVLMVETVLNGTVDAIKLELELLPAVGEVRVWLSVSGTHLPGSEVCVPRGFYTWKNTTYAVCLNCACPPTRADMNQCRRQNALRCLIYAKRYRLSLQYALVS